MRPEIVQKGQRWLVCGPLGEDFTEPQAALLGRWLLQHGPIYCGSELVEAMRDHPRYRFSGPGSARAAVRKLRIVAEAVGAPMLQGRGVYGWDEVPLDLAAIDARLAELERELRKVQSLREQLAGCAA